MPHVVVITRDTVGATMGGNAIRATELARALAAHADVVLAAPGELPPGLEGVRHAPYALDDQRPLRDALHGADAVVTQPQSPLVSGWLRASGARIVYDLYDPLVLDMLEAMTRSSRATRLYWNTLAVDHFLDALHTGHHFVCAGERQRDLYIGALLASRLVSPEAYARDPSLRSVIDVVPVGLPARPPQPLPGVGARASFPAIGPDDEIALWNGGIWNWLDPETAVRAGARLAERRPQVRLVFMRAPGAAAEGDEGRAARAARAAADELGVAGRVVFFNEGVVAYAERDSWLLEADCLLSTHVDHLEAHFSFRTRLLDSFWAGVPAACTAGDELAELIERRDLGATFAPGDADAAADGLERVLERGRASYADALARTAEEFTWPRVTEPLVRYVTAPGRPRALGEPVARRLASPARRARALAARALRSLGR